MSEQPQPITDWRAEIEKRLRAAFPNAQEIVVTVTCADTGKFKCRVVNDFEQKMPVGRHRAIMKAVGLSSTDDSSDTNVAVHALEVEALTPADVAK